MEYGFGTIKVEAEVQGEDRGKVECLSDAVAKYNDLGDEQKEHFYTIFLTNSNEVIGDKLIGLGGSDAAPVDIKDIVRTAVLVNAGAVILIHNHPSGTPDATLGDIKTTQKIHDTLDQVGVTLLDHVIIGRNKHHSMKQSHDGPFQ